MIESLVSVIMPTYNHGRFLRESIKSVLTQSYKSIELIIIDNYSDDDTEAIVMSFTDKRISYSKCHNHGVIAVSRNVGIGKARGDYIAFIDSDDTWYPDKLSLQMEYFSKYPEVVLLACDLKKCGENYKADGTLLGGMKSEKRGGLYRALLFKNIISCSSVLAKARIFKDVGVFDEDPNIVSIEDWDLWLRVAHAYPICVMPEVLGEYRLHINNISKKSDMLKKMIRVIDKNVYKRWLFPARSVLLKLLVFMRWIRSIIRSRHV